MQKPLHPLFLLLVFALLPISLLGQRNITGMVTDAKSGEPLIAANVTVTGKTIGTITDLDGNYSLEIPDGTESLTFSYIGYTVQEVLVEASNIINAQLVAGTYLDEVVVIGYGEVKQEDATGAVESIGEESFNKGAITSAQELLTGKISGVQITNANDAGGGSQIRIRGGSSLSASNDPLIVIDGVPIDNGELLAGSRNPLNLVNPNDIESMTVLKDASATAIYGSRASNGVILITTKKGKLGKGINVEYNGNFSISNVSRTIDVLSASEFRTLIESRFDEGSDERALLGNAETDWQSEIYQTGIGTDHNISLSGGIKNVLPYRVSLGYTNKNGVLKTDQFERTTAAINLSPKFLDNRLQLNVNFKANTTNNRFADKAAIGSALSFDPTKPVLDPESPFGGYTTWIDNGEPNSKGPSNPLALLELTEDISTVNRYIINGSVDYRIIPSLRANVSLGYDYMEGSGTKFISQDASFAFNSATGGGVNNVYTQEKENKLFEAYLAYEKSFGKHKLDIMGGHSYQNFFKDKYTKDSDVAGTPENIREDLSNPEEIVLISFFGRANLNLFDKVLLTGTLRRDGSSRFIEENRWGLFPAAAVAWKVLDNPKSNRLSQLKLRLGFGVTGQQDVGGAYDRLAVYRVNQTGAQYLFDGEPIDTWRPEPYTFLKWEETTTYNLGIDYGFFKDRLFGSIELYQRNTIDLLNFAPIAAGVALTNEDDQNIGSLENRGIEFSINAVPVQTSKSVWDIGFNVSLNRNEITQLTLGDDPNYQGVATGDISGGTGNKIQIHSVGFPTRSFYVWEQVYNETGQPLDGVYVDRNGDGELNNSDLYRLENPAPDVYIGLTTNYTYGNWDLALAGRAQFGNYIYNNILADKANYAQLRDPGVIRNVHSLTESIGFENANFSSDYFIQNASFARLDHVTIGYNFPDLIKKLNNLKVFVTVQNPVLITKYEGIDPETNEGIDKEIYPRSRTFLFGVNARF